MKIETLIDSLVSYAMNRGLAEPVDHQVLTNRLLDILRKDDYESSDEPQSEDLEEILAGILDYAVENGLCEDNITARDIFDTRIMGAVTPASAVTPITCAATALPRICTGSMPATTARWTSPST